MKLKDGAAFSGYYEPVVKASRTRKPGYTAPLYRVPPDLRELNLGSFKSELIGQRVVYRMEKGKPVPYYTRPKSTGWTAGPRPARKGAGTGMAVRPRGRFFPAGAGFGAAALRGRQGDARALCRVQRQAVPEHRAVSRRSGEIPTGQVSMQSIRQWLRDHPELRDDLLRRNQRYIFFRKGPETSSGSITSGPVGSMGSPLSSMVSLAVDRTTFPLGSVLAFDVNIPDPSSPVEEGPVSTTPLFGIGLAQDTERPSRDAASTCSAARVRGRPISRGTSTAPVKSGCCWRSNTCL